MQKLKSNPTSHSLENHRLDPDFRRDDKQLFVLLMCLAFVYFFYLIYSHSSFLFKKFDPIQAEKIYSQSQWQQSQNVATDKILDEWAVQNHYTGWKNYEDVTRSRAQIQAQKEKIIKAVQDKGISDSFLYSYVGYKYINGTNPSLLNPEHPPLAKYLIGFSIRFFGNEHILGIGIALLTLLLVAVISYQLFGSLLHAGLALFLTSIFPLFGDQIIHGPQLELYQLFFFLLLVCFLLMGIQKKQWFFYVFSGINFGLLLSTKTVAPFFLLFGAWLIISLGKKWREIAIIIGVGALTFIATYYQFFALGGTLRTFLGLQKYIIIFYRNSHIPFFEFVGNYLRLIFTGTWKFWDSARSVSFYSGWNIVWPLLFVFGLWQMARIWKKNPTAHILIYFILLYNVFVFFTPIFPRYLLLLFVPLIIMI